MDVRGFRDFDSPEDEPERLDAPDPYASWWTVPDDPEEDYQAIIAQKAEEEAGFPDLPDPHPRWISPGQDTDEYDRADAAHGDLRGLVTASDRPESPDARAGRPDGPGDSGTDTAAPEAIVKSVKKSLQESISATGEWMI